MADPGETIVITATHDSDQIGQPQTITIDDDDTAGVSISPAATKVRICR